MSVIEALDPVLMMRRFALIQERYWPLDEAVAHYGYNPDVLAAWGVLGDDGLVDRHGLEFQSVKRRWLSVRLAAAELSMTEASVRELLKLAGQRPELSDLLPEHSIGLPGGAGVQGGAFNTPAAAFRHPQPTPLIRGGESLDDWIYSVVGRDRIWMSVVLRARALHEALNARLEGEGIPFRVEPLWDEVSRRYWTLAPDLFPEVTLAWEWCALSRAPVALQHSAVLWPTRGRKPIALAPDRVGWHVMLACPEIEMHVLGGQGAFEMFQERVRGAVAHA